MLWSWTTAKQIDDTWTHKCANRQFCSALTLTITALRICQKVQTGELGACAAVVDYIQNTDKEHIISTMIASMDDSFPDFVLGMKNNFLELKYVHYMF